ncbi:MAG: hypothetical protein ACXQS8_08780 [Candidatus Helarchaeales archaeon]
MCEWCHADGDSPDCEPDCEVRELAEELSPRPFYELNYAQQRAYIREALWELFGWEEGYDYE